MIKNTHLHPVTRVGKRLVDIIGASLGLLLTALLLPVIALALCMESPGPVFFRQMRVGRMYPEFTELFMMIKFRTMHVGAETKSGPVWAKKRDPRVTRVGRFLRKTRLDELPQFANVLRGEMSLIGPRPERPGICDKLEVAIPLYAERTFGVAPGISGLAQVNQGYDESIEDVRSKVAYDHAYSIVLSKPGRWILTDLSIVWRTLTLMACGRGQ